MKHFAMYMFLFLSFTFVSCGPRSPNNNIFKDEIQENIILSLVTQEPLSSPSQEGYIAFAEKLYELSGGSITVQVSMLLQSRTLKDMLEAVRSGAVDIATMGYSDQSDMIPELVILGEAYLVRDYEHYVKILESDFGKKMSAEFGKLGVVDSGIWYAGFRQTTSNRPLNSLKDFEGLRLRVPSTSNLNSYATSLGAEYISIPFGFVREAIENNDVDAQENPISTIEAARLYEGQKYIAITEHRVGTVSLFINKEKYDTFTEQQKAWYHEAVYRKNRYRKV